MDWPDEFKGLRGLIRSCSCYSGFVVLDSSTETNCHGHTEASLLLEYYLTIVW